MDSYIREFSPNKYMFERNKSQIIRFFEGYLKWEDLSYGAKRIIEEWCKDEKSEMDYNSQFQLRSPKKGV